MNLLGISWGMGARDVGMKAAVTGAQNNLDNINDSLEKQSKIAAKSKGPGFWAKMKDAVKDFNIASIASDVRSLTGDTGNLTNSLEAMGVANAKAAKPFVASLNLSGRAARKMTAQISGMAIGLNVGAETVAQTFKSMAQATGPTKEALDALGWSQKDWVKITETTGIKIDDMTDAMGGLGAWWQATAKDEAAFVNRLADIGRKAGVGMEPLKKLKGNLEGLAKTFEKVPPAMRRSGDEMMALSESGVRLSGAFREMGSSEEEAVELGQKTVQMFADQSVAVEQAMKYGIGSLDDSPLFKWLTSVGVGMDEAVSIIDTGSRDAVKGTQLLQGVFDRFGKGGAQQQAMLSQLSGALGDAAGGLGYLAQRGDIGAKSLERVSKITTDGKFSLKDYADQAFSSGRTLQDSFDLAKEGFDTQIRSIARADVVGLVKGKMSAFREVAKEIKVLAGDETWGPLVKGMSMFKQMGVQGVLLQIGKTMGLDTKAAQKMSVKFGLVFDTVQDLAKEMGPLMNMLGQFGPLGIAAGGIVGFFMLSDADRQKIVDMLAPIWEKVKKAASDIWYGTEGKGGLKGWLIGAWDSFSSYVKKKWPEWKESLKGVFTWLSMEVLPGMVEFAKTIGKNVFDALVDNFGTGGAVIGGAFAGAIMGANFGPFGGLIGFVAGALIGAAEAAISDAESRIKGFEDAQKAKADADKAAEAAGGAEVQARRLKDLDALKQAYEEAQFDITGNMVFMGDNFEKDPGFIKFREEYNKAIGGLAPKPIDFTSIIGGKGVGKAILGQQVKDMMAEQDKVRAEKTLGAAEDIKSIGWLGNVIWGVGGWGANIGEHILKGWDDWDVSGKINADLAAIGKGEKLGEQQTLMEQFAGVQHLPEVQAKFKALVDSGASAVQVMAAAQEAVTKYGKQASDDLTRNMIQMQSLNGELYLTTDNVIGNLKGVASVLGTTEDALLADAVAQGWDANEMLLQLSRQLGAVSGMQVHLVDQGQLDMLMEADKLTKDYIDEIKSMRDIGVITDADADYEIENAEWLSEVKANTEQSVPGMEVDVQSTNPLAAAAQAFASSVKNTMGAVGSAMQVVASGFDAQNKIIATNAYVAGQMIMKQQSLGIAENAYLVEEASWTVASETKSVLGAGSPIEKGPLGHVGEGGEADPAWLAGRTLMESLAEGITSGVDVVADAVTNALDESVLASFEAYNAEMKKIASKKSLLNEVAGMLMRDFGSKIESTITIEGKTSNVKENMKAMLSVPGIAGVTMAIINESAKQMKILDKIREHTETIAKSDLVAKGKATGATYTLSS